MGFISKKILPYIAFFRAYLVRALYIQLFMTIISFPILVWWGIPISTYSLISTTLFTPFLLLFLLLASLLFFSNLLSIPSQPIAWGLEVVSSVWTSLITWHSGPLLIGFCKPPVIILILLLIATLFVACKRSILINQKTLYLSIFLSLTLIGCKTIFTPRNGSFFIPCHTGTVEIINYKKTIILIDSGIIGARPSASSWISYEFVSELIKATGRTSLDHVILCRINQRTCQAILALLEKISIKNLYVPAWDGKVPYAMYRLWKRIIETFATKQGIIYSIHPTEMVVIDNIIAIHTKPRITRYHDATYHQLLVRKSLP